MKIVFSRVVGLLILACSASTAAGEPRVEVYVMQYSSPGGANNQPYFSDTVRDRLSLLREQISSRAQGAAYLRRMTIIPKPGEAAPSDAQLLQRWKNDRPRALLFMWGRIEPGATANVAISSIYIGDLAPRPLDKIDLAKINLSAANDPQIRDTHSLVAGLALLLDGRRNGLSRATLAAILATVYNVYERVRVSPYRPPELAQIKASLDQIGRDLRTP